MARQPETLFKDKVTKELRARFHGEALHIIKTSERSVRGVPDLLIFFRGTCTAWELKTEDGVVEELQQWTLDKIQASGNLAIVVRPSTLESALAQLQNLPV